MCFSNAGYFTDKKAKNDMIKRKRKQMEGRKNAGLEKKDSRI